MVQSMTVFNSEEVDTKKQPMFFGQPLGIQRYDSYKYPIFDKLTTQQLGYFWRPEEVSLQKDRGDYQSLRPEQKHIFTSNLKYQVMLDSVQGRGPGMAFAPYCSLPELEACMKVWEFMEMIHSRSYTYIIKNVYSDPSEVFDTILREDRIMERAVSVTEAYNDFINSAQHYGTSEIWKYAQEQVPHALGERYELKRKLFRAVANVNILEGIRFYVSFACSFAFGELKLMEGSAKIISLIARDENQHLVITQNIMNKWKEGDDPEMAKIAKEEEQWVYKTFENAVNQEKLWAEYLFKDGSMIGLNDKLLQQYVEWIA
ncbi:MAG: class Ia ribonucleoside-diphosphate reductase subunit beta, partial [Candidatus Nanopelagicaceae bacterium]